MFAFFTIIINIYKMKNSSLIIKAFKDFIASARVEEGF
jgi:hypothetical protein